MATRRVTAALALLTALSNWADGVPKAPFKPDAHTTLLAHFDGTVRADLAKGERAAVFRNGFGGKTLPPGQVHLAPHEGFGQAVHLRASEQIVYKVEDGNFPFDPADIYAAGTIEFLIKTSWAGDDGALHTVFIADDGKNRNYVRLDKMKGNTLDASVASTKPGGKKRWSSVRRAVTAKTWPNDTWRHVAVCWGNGVLTLWVDGEIWDRATGVSSPVGLPAAGIVLQGNGALIDELRVSNIIRYGSHTMQASNLIHHSSFEGETAGQPPRQTWHRVGSYLPEETPWRVKASDAFHGEQCVRTDKPGKLTFQREIHERGQGEYVLSVYLKAAKSSHKAKLSLTTYRKWDPFRTDTFEKSVEVGLEWTRHVFPIDIPSADCRPILGAVDIGIESLEPGALLADAVQFEMGPQATPYGEPDMLLSKQRAEGLHFP
ncbi:MAG: hypothetical protein KAI66_13445, partial [Lentisphaeria bacterium]|nr:hypothetical protein [Lentisphaeria bacterium]